MRNLIFLIIFAVILGCNIQPKNSTIQKIKKQKFSNEKKSIELIGKIFQKSNNQLSFEKIQLIQLDLNEDEYKDTILLEKIKEWINVEESQHYKWTDPGEFHRIKISISGGKEMILLNTSGWMENNFLAEYDKDFNNENMIKSEYITIKRASDENILIFISGYTYASTPGLLTIVNIYNNDNPILIFNLNTELFNFKDYNKDGVKDLGTTVWDGFYEDEQENKYRYKVYLLDGGFTYSEKYSRLLSEEIYQTKE